jgi:trans-2-enoyl-CoA reductase
MQPDAATAALGGAVVMIIFVTVPALVLFIAILIGVARLRVIKEESVKQTEILRGLRSQLQGLLESSASKKAVAVGQG